MRGAVRWRWMSQELAPLLLGPAAPDSADGRPRGVEHPLPRHALSLRGCDLGPHPTAQRERRGAQHVAQERRPGPARLVAERREASARHRQHRPDVALVGQLQGDIDHGQTRADQQDRRFRIQVGEGVGRPGVGREQGRVVEPAVRSARRLRRQVADGHDHGGGQDRAAVLQPHAALDPGQDDTGSPAQGGEAWPIGDRARLVQTLLQIGPEHRARQEGRRQVATAFLERVGGQVGPCGQPV
jgi:hypothetical protein